MRKFIICLLALLSTSACGYNTIKQKEELTTNAWKDLGSSCCLRLASSAAYIDTVQRQSLIKRDIIKQVEKAMNVALQEGCPASPPDITQNLDKFREVQDQLTFALAKLQVEIDSVQELCRDESYLIASRKMELAEHHLNEAIINYNSVSHDFNISKKGFPNSLTNALLLRYDDKKQFGNVETIRLADRLDS